MWGRWKKRFEECNIAVTLADYKYKNKYWRAYITCDETRDLIRKENVDIQYGAHHVFLSWPSSGIIEIKKNWKAK